MAELAVCCIHNTCTRISYLILSLFANVLYAFVVVSAKPAICSFLAIIYYISHI
jgi:hypothetical protein